MTVVRPVLPRTAAATASGPAAAGFDVRIDELVLHGFRPGDRHEIAAAVEEELARLLAGAPVPPRWVALGGARRAVPTLDAGAVELPAGGGPRAVGVELARAVHGVLVAGPGKREGGGSDAGGVRPTARGNGSGVAR